MYASQQLVACFVQMWTQVPVLPAPPQAALPFSLGLSYNASISSDSREHVYKSITRHSECRLVNFSMWHIATQGLCVWLCKLPFDVGMTTRVNGSCSRFCFPYCCEYGKEACKCLALFVYFTSSMAFLL